MQQNLAGLHCIVQESMYWFLRQVQAAFENDGQTGQRTHSMLAMMAKKTKTKAKNFILIVQTRLL